MRLGRFGVAVLLLMMLLPVMALGEGADMHQLGADAANYAMTIVLNLRLDT